MTSDTSPPLLDLFVEALGLPPHLRLEFARAQCPDGSNLQQELLALLHTVHSQLGTFLEQPVALRTQKPQHLPPV